MLRAVIVEDEKRSRETLSGLLKLYCKNVEVVAEADGVKTGISAITEYKPDIIFLDIQMPDGSGFKLLEELEDYNFDVIFTTAYDQFAIKAIKFSALDYLLKPIFPDDLKVAVNKAEEKQKQQNLKPNIDALLGNYKRPDEEPNIVLSTSDKVSVVKISEIVRCESSNYYTFFYFIDRKRILVSRTLKDNEELLSEYNFLRIHKSHLINLKYVTTFSRNERGFVLMADGSEVPVSRRKREKVLEILSNL
jgi:two-component system LytT family response regulator